MSKLDELINNLCPNGVDKYTLGSIADYSNGKSHENDVSDVGTFTLITSKFISTEGQIKRMCMNRFSPIEKGEIAMVLSDLPNGKALAKCFLVEEDGHYTVNQRICKLKPNLDIVRPKFLYYILNRNKDLLSYDSKVDQTNLTRSQVENLVLHIPKFEVQDEIVRILNSFTELESELESELEARTKQYEYYRNKLLDFSTGLVGVPRIDVMLSELCPMGVELRTIEDVGTYRRGSFPQPYGLAKWYDDENGMPFVQVVDVENDKFLLTPDTRRKISIEAQKMSVFAPIGTLIVTIQGTIGRVAITQYEAFIDRTLLVFKETDKNINKKFLAYVLKQKFALEEKTARGSTLKTITKEELKNFLIPIPPLEIQEEIVRILDTFSEYVTSISQGLPAEIAARRKQYEYYRNKLLTF
jgi:type I restriction enzyme S subunit